MVLARRRWSKLRSRLYNLMIADFQMHIALWRMDAEPIPRFWITLGRGAEQQVIFDYPHCETDIQERQKIQWLNHMDVFSELIDEYINTSQSELICAEWNMDKYHLADILKACDRRIGLRRLEELTGRLKNEQALVIVQRRLNKEVG